MNKKEKLYREIEKFIKWADQCQPAWSEERDNGEWELGYPHFEELCGAAEDVVNEYPCSEADESLIHALLFVIARDNECEELVEEKLALHVLAKLNSPKLVEYLERAMKSDYKWLRRNAEELSAKYN